MSATGGAHVLDDQVEQRRQVRARVVELAHRPAMLGAGVDVREVELVLVGVERREQVEDLVQDLGRALLGLVDLVDHRDRPQPFAQRLAEHELGLRHRPLGRVDQEQAAVDHGQDALDLAAEIGVARRVDDVDPHALPDHRGALGQDGDPALALEVVAVHRPLLNLLVLAERAGLLQQPVDQGRLAVVDVRDDRDVAQFHEVRSGGRFGARSRMARASGRRAAAYSDPRPQTKSPARAA